MAIGFIGLGNMAGAIIKGMRADEAFKTAQIIGCDLDPEKGEYFRGHYGVQVLEGAAQVAQEADVLVLAVKPQGIAELLGQIKNKLAEDRLIISIIAGKTLRFYAEHAGSGLPVVRAMPNINAKARASATALCGNAHVSDAMMKSAEGIFSSVGTVIPLTEDKLSAFSAVAGAGPAFVYLFIDALTTAGIRYGMPRAHAQQAACDMVLGSAKLVRETGEHPRALIDQVTSPGGTTIEGMHKLTELGFEHAVHMAVQAVIEKDAKV